MKTILAAIILVALCLVSLAQFAGPSIGSGKFQEVGGDFGKAWISNLQAQNPKLAAAQANNSTLWDWGTTPKGKELKGGKLVDANQTWLYNTANWMGDNYVDPYTGNYVDPNTGLPVYRNLQVFPNEGTEPPSYYNQQSYLPPFLQ